MGDNQPTFTISTNDASETIIINNDLPAPETQESTATIKTKKGASNADTP